MSPGEHPFDSGLQPERTELAWQRASLALIGVSLGSIKITWTFLGPWSLLCCGMVALSGVVLMWASRRRYGRVHRWLTRHDGRPPRLEDGRLPLLATISCLTLCVIAVVGMLASLRTMR